MSAPVGAHVLFGGGASFFPSPGGGWGGCRRRALLLPTLPLPPRLAPPPPAPAAARRNALAQQTFQLDDDVLGLHVFQRERSDEPLVFLAGLLGTDDFANLAQVDNRVHCLQPVRSSQRNQLPVGAFHRGQFFDRLVSQHRLQSEGHFDEFVIVALVEFVFGHARDESRIELVDFLHGHHFAIDENRESASQQVPVQDVTNFRHGVPPSRDDIDVALGQLFPVEAGF